MLRILLFLLALPCIGMAQDYPAPLSDTVSDYADLLSPDQEAELSTRLQSAREETGVHITVALMSRISDHGGSGQSIETYGKKLFNHWGIGDPARNDGILILVAKEDREMRIALGAGFDPVYDGLAQRVMDRDMLPLFRDGDYPGGIAAGANAVIRDLATPFAAHATPKPVENTSDDSSFLWVFGGFIAIFAGAGALIVRSVFGDFFTRFRACPQCGTRGLHRHSDVLNAATTTMAGGGIRITRCNNCDYDHRESYVIPRQGDHNFDNDNSGFGGGGSSGGGATGKW